MIKYAIVLIVFVVGGWGAYSILHNDLYPAVVVNWNVITGREWDQAFVPALNYYRTLKKPDVDEAAFEKEVRRAVLDRLVELELVYTTVRSADVDQAIAQLLMQNKNLKEGAEKLYRLSWEEFQQFVLRPQVALELLQRQLQTTNETLDAWLKKEKTSARVMVFARGFVWSGENVQVK